MRTQSPEGQPRANVGEGGHVGSQRSRARLLDLRNVHGVQLAQGALDVVPLELHRLQRRLQRGTKLHDGEPQRGGAGGIDRELLQLFEQRLRICERRGEVLPKMDGGV